MIDKLQPNQVFVFGSNLAGRHGAGAAKQAREQFGAVYGVGEGIMRQSYAFPTLDRHFKRVPLQGLMASRDRLYSCCYDNPDKQFLLTKVGCGLAGYEESIMRELFSDSPPANLVLPEDWRAALDQVLAQLAESRGPSCHGSGCEPDETGVQKDDVCSTCQGEPYEA